MVWEPKTTVLDRHVCGRAIRLPRHRVRGTKTALSGSHPEERIMSQQTIITILKHDHDEVDAFLEQAERAIKAEKRRELFAEINAALVAHTRFEETEIYPVLKQRKSSHDEALEAVEEHAVVKHLLQEIAATDVDDERWKATVMVLAESVRHHVKEEEQRGGLFDELKKAMKPDELVALGEAYISSKQHVGAQQSG
jgi:hemerythrin superfamily protein